MATAGPYTGPRAAEKFGPCACAPDAEEWVLTASPTEGADHAAYECETCGETARYDAPKAEAGGGA